MDITIKKMAEKLKEFSEYRIVYYIRPDGDCCELDCDAPTAKRIMEKSARNFLEKYDD